MKLPAATPVKVTVQPPDASRVRLASTVPMVLSEEVKLTLTDGMFAAFVVSVTETVQDPVRPCKTELGQTTLVEVSSLDVAVTVTATAALVLPLWLESPPYAAATDPEPAAVPVNVTEQLPADSAQLVALNEPPVVPAVRVNVTSPVGVFEGVVVSATVALTVVVQLVEPNAILQPPFVTVMLVEESSLPVTVTVTVAAALVLPL